MAESDFEGDPQRLLSFYVGVCLLPHNICFSLGIASPPLSLGFKSCTLILLIPREEAEPQGLCSAGSTGAFCHAWLACVCRKSELRFSGLHGQAFYPLSLSSLNPAESLLTSLHFSPSGDVGEGSCALVLQQNS